MATKRVRSDSDSTSQEEGLVPSGLLPSYLAGAFAELFEKDGLAVMGRGLGSLQLLATFCRFYADVEDGYRAVQEDDNPSVRNIRSPPLVIVLGLKEAEWKALLEILVTWGTPAMQLPTIITNEAGQKEDRKALYTQGGVFVVTSRILIVDLLNQVADPQLMEGLLVYHADQVTEESTIAFIIRIFQSQKQPIGSGFVKAISHSPEALLSGFGKVDKVLKSLHVRNLYLYPRFHDEIRNELEERPPRVIELRQELSPLQQQMQHALAAAVTACLRELKQNTSHLVEVNLNDEELSVENCVTKNFDRAITRQLEPDWHRLTPSVKQLVQDLKSLRTLFHSLLTYDSITFWKVLTALQTSSAASRHPSMWLLTPAADLLFRKAKERVYKIDHGEKPTPENPDPVGSLEAVLEENPKWRLLGTVLEEIRSKDAKEQQESSEDDVGSGPRFVLVVAKDNKTVDTLRTYLVDGKNLLNFRWLHFLEQINDRSRSLTSNKGSTSAISEESRLLLEEESRIRNLLFGPGGRSGRRIHKPTRELNAVPQHLRKRRKIAAEHKRGRATGAIEDLEREAVLDDAVEDAEHSLKEASDSKLPIALREDDDFRVSNPNELRIVIRSHNSLEGGNALQFLQDMEPRYVVLYDSDIAFVRNMEVYQSLSTHPDPLQVYFLLFEASAEEKNFVKNMEREQNAFERLIHHKKTMPPPALRIVGATQEMQLAVSGGSYMGGTLPLACDTRRGKGKADRSKERRDIAVDVREFRSALPSILHQGGMRLAPVTLTVGDFVLSTVHCVERKSISDLIGSFASGRLYTQAEAMSKYYECPCLLIEFEAGRSFQLQNSNELGVDIRQDSISSKLSLLCLHFPKLRILWSRSPHETLRIFRELKKSHKEVDVQTAVDIGKDESLDALLQQGQGDEDAINEAARDMLLRLPGVNLRIARRVMQEVDSLAELSELSREELRRIAGPSTGQRLFTFFRQHLAST